MKNYLFILLFLSAVSVAQAQQPKRVSEGTSSDFHSHNGFHIEFGLGPVFGTVTDTYTGYYVAEFSGTGAAIDMRIGGALRENLILTFDILSKAVVSPEVTLNSGGIYPTSNDVSLSEVTYGAGLTYYAMPTDIFVSASLGTGTFVIKNSNETTRSKFGFSGQLKVGKHWWISKTWGISLAGVYGFTSVDNTSINSYAPENISSNRFAIIVSIGIN